MGNVGVNLYFIRREYLTQFSTLLPATCTFKFVAMQNHRGLFYFEPFIKTRYARIGVSKNFFHTIEYTAFRPLVIYKYQIFFFKKGLHKYRGREYRISILGKYTQQKINGIVV